MSSSADFFNKLSLSEVKKYAKAYGIPVSKKKKSDLVDELSKVEILRAICDVCKLDYYFDAVHLAERRCGENLCFKCE